MMATETNRYRVFLSSPGDVGREREVVIQVVERLKNRWCGKIDIDLYVWEHEPMLASLGDFQENIPPTSDFDLVICVFWSRLGTRPNPAKYRRPDGSFYSSGTEYEFETALEAFRKKGHPDLLVYRRNEIPLFPASPRERRAMLERQWEALEQFCRKWFFDEELGSFRLALNPYEDLAEFEETLDRHLQELLQAHLRKRGVLIQPQQELSNVRCLGTSPYRGLQVFEAEHEAIFFGRTKQRDEILGILQARHLQEKRTFVLIFGASGSGKSSLLRAGVMPWLCRSGVVDGVGIWRSLVFRPSDHTGDLLEGLAVAMLRPTALPEIGADGTDARKLGNLLQRNPEGLAMLVKEALSRVAGEEQNKRDLLQQPVARLAVGLDQLEELFTLSERFSAEERESFFKAVRTLADSGYGWIVATLRSDFFSRCEEISDLVELKQGKGQYHLLPPDAVELSQIIRYPAEAAGVVFEEHPEKGRLDDRIRDDALRESAGLPLLEYALDELFRVGASDLVLSHSEYEVLGGVEGALRKRAEETFASLNPLEKEAIDSVLFQLVSLVPGSEYGLSRRVSRYEKLTSSTGATGLVDAFINARLFTADRSDQGERTVTATHEALLRVWPPVSRWAEEHRKFLRAHAKLVESFKRWLESGSSPDYLLSPGRELSQAEELLAEYRTNLELREQQYILASIAAVAKSSKRRPWQLVGATVVTALIIGVLLRQTWPNLNYSLRDNRSFLQFPFLSALVGLSVGLSASVIEVLRERWVLRQERIAKLGPTRWLLSRYIASILLTIVPLAAYVVITFWLLEIRELYLLYVVYLVIVAAFGAAVALMLCSFPQATPLVVTTIVLFLVAQILCGGSVYIPYESLQHLVLRAHDKREIPEVGQLMPLRWAYEGLLALHLNNSRFGQFEVLQKSEAALNTMGDTFYEKVRNPEVSVPDYDEDEDQKDQKKKAAKEAAEKQNQEIAGRNVELSDQINLAYKLLQAIDDALSAKPSTNSPKGGYYSSYKTQLGDLMWDNNPLHNGLSRAGKVLQRYKTLPFVSEKDQADVTKWYNLIPTECYNAAVLAMETVCALVVSRIVLSFSVRQIRSR
jgi:ElaB/YqjD/DUF883 family membrane-anchored ribosome-binding protein